jgi:hypothetical protein
MAVSAQRAGLALTWLTIFLTKLLNEVKFGGGWVFVVEAVITPHRCHQK